MNRFDFEEITVNGPFPDGGESLVFPIPRSFYGDKVSRVVKLFRPRKLITASHTLRPRTHEEMNERADTEFGIGNLLWEYGLNVPRMDMRTSFPSPKKGHILYNGGERVPAVIMERFSGLNEFENIPPELRTRALDSFSEQMIGALELGLSPSDTSFNKNVLYDSRGNAHLFDFSQWDYEKTPKGKGIDYFKLEGVLPDKIWDGSALERII